MEIFAGGEHSTIEYLQAGVLLIYLALMVYVFIARSELRDAGYLLAGILIGLLFLMIGRELSYGKYHGVPHPVRTAMRLTSIAAVLLFWAVMARTMGNQLTTSFHQARRFVADNRILVTTVFILIVVSQLVDKDWIYAIRPPELAQALEEGLELIAYFVLAVFLRRLLNLPMAAEAHAEKLRSTPQ